MASGPLTRRTQLLRFGRNEQESRGLGVPFPALGVRFELLEEALAALGEGNDELRIGLLSGLARGLSLAGEPERGAIVRGNANEHGTPVQLQAQ